MDLQEQGGLIKWLFSIKYNLEDSFIKKIKNKK